MNETVQDPPRLVVLSLDGVPHGLLREFIASGDAPAIAALCERCGEPRIMRSVLPTVSNVAWTCYATARNPGKHGIYGFLDRRPGTYDLIFPNARNLRGKHIWEILSERGMKVFGMNVPGTYPPRAVNGVLIGGFLSPSPVKAAYPPSAAAYLQQIGYVIDTDAELARRSKQQMLAELDRVLETHRQAMLHFLKSEKWDFFHTHVMGTDRINHFLLSQYRRRDKQFAPAFVEYYRKVDSLVADLLEVIGPDTPLIILSDHGFCEITYEVQLSRYLVETGWMRPASEVTGPFSFDPSRTRAYTLIPGRIYVNLTGREAQGCVAGEQYEQVRREISEDLMKLRDPEGNAVIRCVLKREEIYWGSGAAGPDERFAGPSQLPPYTSAPDLVAVPYDGYDLKLGLTSEQIFVNTELEGMHTYHDAMILGRNVEIPDGDFEIRRLGGPILRTLKIEPPEELDVHPTGPPRSLNRSGTEGS